MPDTTERALVGDRRPPSRGDQQRALIIASVVELLETVPIANLSVLQIAKHAGVTRPAFYFYFDSKYTVVAAALQQVWTAIEAGTTGLDSFDFQEPPAAFSERMIGNVIEVWRQNAALLDACMQSADPQLSGMWADFVSNLSARIAAFTERVRNTGAIQPIIDDVPALIDTLVGMMISILRNDIRRSRPELDTRLLAAARAIWLASVWGEPE